MRRPLQIVLDTNVIVAALRSRRGASFRIVRLIGITELFQINVSVPLVLEYEEVAKRQSEASGLSEQDIEEFVDYLCAAGNRRRIHYLWRPILRDADDDMILELAVAAGCDCIVTFNRRHIGITEKLFGIRVLSPREFLREIDQKS